MNLFKNYQPLKPNDKKTAMLNRKIVRIIKQPKVKYRSTLLYRMTMVTAAMLLFAVGISYLSNNTSDAPEEDEEADYYSKSMTFTGESEHWKAVHEVFIQHRFTEKDGVLSGQTFKDGELKLFYKGEKPDKTDGKFKYNIEGSEGGTGVSSSFPTNGVVTERDVYASQKNDEVKVTVEWDGNKETFTMKYKPGSFEKREVTEAAPLSQVNGYNRFIGIAGEKPFQIASVSSNWSELNQALSVFFGDLSSDKQFPALMATTRDNLSQTVFYMLPEGTNVENVKIIGEHSSGEEKTVFEGNKNTTVAQGLFDAGVVIPAKVKFAKEGLWHITAYTGNDQIGQVTVDVYRKPNVGKAAQPNIFKGALTSLFTMIDGKWSIKGEFPVLTTNQEMTSLSLSILKKRLSEKETETFPVTMIGLSKSGKSFIKTFSEDDAVQRNRYYQIDAEFPLSQGKWELLIFANDFVAGEFFFKVIKY